MTDADTLRNADDLWRLVHRVQDGITKDGRILKPFTSNAAFLANIRELADECDPEYAKLGA